jgi:hypothetical protein
MGYSLSPVEAVKIIPLALPDNIFFCIETVALVSEHRKAFAIVAVPLVEYKVTHGSGGLLENSFLNRFIVFLG